MSREEFMRQLEKLLMDVSEEEKREALSYYRSYFEDAGEENEERILKELESPEKVAATIKADLGMEQPRSEAFTEHGFEDQRFENRQTVDLRKKSSQDQSESRSTYSGNRTLNMILIAAIVIVTSPFWGGLLVGILGSVFGTAIGILAATFALYVAGGVLVGVGIGQFVVGGAAIGFALVGAGMIVLALAILMTALCIWICGKAIPWICNVIGRLWRSIFGGRERVI